MASALFMFCGKVCTAMIVLSREVQHKLRPGRIVLYCGKVPVANDPGCTVAEGLLYEPWSLVVPTCTARCLHHRP